MYIYNIHIYIYHIFCLIFTNGLLQCAAQCRTSRFVGSGLEFPVSPALSFGFSWQPQAINRPFGYGFLPCDLYGPFDPKGFVDLYSYGVYGFPAIELDLTWISLIIGTIFTLPTILF